MTNNILVKKDNELLSVPIETIIENIDTDTERLEIIENFPISTSMKALRRLSNNKYTICLEIKNYIVNMRVEGSQDSDSIRDVAHFFEANMNRQFRENNLAIINSNVIRDTIIQQRNLLQLKIEEKVYFYSTVYIDSHNRIRFESDSTLLSHTYNPNDVQPRSSESAFCCPNVYSGAKLCLGNNSSDYSKLHFEDLSEINKIYSMFLGSIFNNDLRDNNFKENTRKKVMRIALERAVEEGHPYSAQAQYMLDNQMYETISSGHMSNIFSYCYRVIIFYNFWNVPISDIHKAF